MSAIVERLRREVNYQANLIRSFEAEIKRTTERFTQENEGLRELLTLSVNERKEAGAEIEQLRGLLREWVDSPCQPIAVDILRRTQEALDHD